jgi:NADH:ubiquinone oxidoreductase subunit
MSKESAEQARQLLKGSVNHKCKEHELKRKDWQKPRERNDNVARLR